MPLDSIDDGKCCQCKKKNAAVVSQLKFLIDGKQHRPGLCHSCYDLVQGKAFCCPHPECRTVYKATEEWVEKANLLPLNTVPCPKHSASKYEPMFICDVCELPESPSQARVSSRGKVYCKSCVNWTKPIFCNAPYCGTLLSPDDPSVVSTPQGQNHYCSDCSLVRTSPKAYLPGWHPLSWEYRADCHCAGCSHLRGKSDKWPEAAVMPEIDSVCISCDEEVASKSAKKISIYHLCHKCENATLQKCPGCKEKLPHSLFIPIVGHYSDDGPKCKICVEASGGFWLCDVNCGMWYPNEEECDCGGVYGYTYTPPTFNFLTGSREKINDRTPFLGLELEVEALKGGSKSHGSKLVRQILGSKNVYCVHDGTLLGGKPDGTGGTKGFEIVTHPFTLSWLYENWGTFERLMEELVKYGYRSWEGGRCGIHIHISRSCMSDARQRKFISFLWDSPRLCMTIGQRTHADKGLTKFAPFDAEKRSQIMAKIKHFKNPGVAGNKHYTAINTNKESTIEARWFRGTLNPLGVLKNIQFIHSVYEFTGQFGHVSANEINYIGWLRSTPQAKTYSALLDYIEHNYVTRR